MRILIGLLKFILGVSLAIAIIGASGLYGARYVMTRLSASPERPFFPEEGPSSFTGGSGNGDGTPETVDSDAPNDTSSPEADEPVDSVTQSELEAGAYEARVIQPIGLILRQGPDVSTTQIGGIAYNEGVIVLSESSDQRWIKVRLPDSGVEGWVKNGNTEKLN